MLVLTSSGEPKDIFEVAKDLNLNTENKIKVTAIRIGMPSIAEPFLKNAPNVMN